MCRKDYNLEIQVKIVMKRKILMKVLLLVLYNMIIQLPCMLTTILFQFCGKFASVGVFQNRLTYSTPFII